MDIRATLLPMTEPMPTEVRLVADFDEWYHREYPSLIGVAIALAGADGEDLVQDTMVRTLVNWERVSRLERPGGWCHRVLINLARSRWRRRMTASRHLARQRRDEAISAPRLTDEVLTFWAAVRRLPERQRYVVTLYYAGDRPVTEIAEVMGVPEGTVRSDLARARAVLTHELEIDDE